MDDLVIDAVRPVQTGVAGKVVTRSPAHTMCAPCERGLNGGGRHGHHQAAVYPVRTGAEGCGACLRSDSARTQRRLGFQVFVMDDTKSRIVRPVQAGVTGRKA